MSDTIAVKDLVKNYGDFCAVNHISFTVVEGTEERLVNKDFQNKFGPSVDVEDGWVSTIGNLGDDDEGYETNSGSKKR